MHTYSALSGKLAAGFAAHLVSTLCVYINRGQEAGLSRVCVYPAQGVKGTLVLHIKYLLLVQSLHRV